MLSFIKKLDDQITISRILILFWSLFWLLNGLDKFFNEEYFFGVTRDEKFIRYFAELGLSADLALFCLYSCGITEIILGLGFLFSFMDVSKEKRFVFLSFKVSIIIFLIFSVFDILFGDRAELWEHSSFLILVIVSVGYFRLSEMVVGQSMP